MRLFVAVPVPEELKAHLCRVISELRRAGADFKWVEPQNLHLTMAFLGETPEGKLPVMEKALDESVAGRSPFELVFGEIGAFDSLDRPRVIWIGIREGKEPLEDMARVLIGALEREGMIPEKERNRSFSAHLTLGRMRSPRNIEKLKAVLKAFPPPEGLSCRVDRLVLVESRLTPKGPHYTPLKERLLPGA